MIKSKARKLISISAIVVLTAALITCTALFAAGVFSSDGPLVPSDGVLNGGVSSSQLNFGVFGQTSTETGTVGKEYTPSGDKITDGAGFRSAFAAGTGDVAESYYLANDITLSASQFGSLVVYQGTFDGNGKTITVEFSKDPANPTKWNSWQGIAVYSSSVSASGMFGRRVSGTVKNVTVVLSGHVKIESSLANGSAFGFIAGWVDGTVENVHIVVNGSATMENISSTANSDIAFGGFAGAAGQSASSKGRFYNVKFTLNGEFCGKSANANRHVFAGGVVGIGTGVDINYAHLAGSANGMMALRGTTGWRMMGGIIGSVRQSGGGKFPNTTQTGAVDLKNIVLTYEGRWISEGSAPENYQGAVIGVAYQSNNTATDTNGGTGVSFLLVTDYRTAGNLATSPGANSSSEQNSDGSTRNTSDLYAAARTNADCAKLVSVTAEETVLGVAYDAGAASDRLKGISATMRGWIATGISDLSDAVGSFVADAANPSMGGYFKFDATAAATAGVDWKWETSYRTEDIGSVPEPYAAPGTPISTAQEFMNLFGTTGAVYGSYRLTADITLPSEYTGSGAEFYGTLDGMGHTVTVSGSAFSAGANYKSYKVTGGVAGVNKGSIYNLKVRLSGSLSFAASYTACSAVGGVAGLNMGLIRNVEVTVEEGATANFSAASGAIAVGGIVGIIDKNGGNTADLYNSRVRLDGTLSASGGSGSFVTVGGAIGVLNAANVGAVEVTGQGVLWAGKDSTPQYGFAGGIIGSVNPGALKSSFYVGQGTVDSANVDNLFLNYYGEAKSNASMSRVASVAGFVKVSSAMSVKTISSYPRPLLAQTVGGRNPSVDGLGGIAAFGYINSGTPSSVNPTVYVQYAEYSLIYGGTEEFKGIAARYGGPDEIEGIYRVSHEDAITAVGSGAGVVVTVMPTEETSYSWEWKRLIRWTTVDTAEKFLKTFYQDANDDISDGVVNGYFQIVGEINLNTVAFADLTPKIIGENTIVDGTGGSKILLSRADCAISPSAVAAGSDYPNAINAAGIIGAVNRGVVRNVSVAISGTATASKANGDLAVGGIVGINRGTILGCTVEIQGNGALNAGVSGTDGADIALGGIAGINHGADAAVSASSAVIDGTLAINGLASGGYAAAGGIIGVLGYGQVNSFNAFKGGGKIGLTAADPGSYSEAVGGIVGSAKDVFGNTDGKGFADANSSKYSRITDGSAIDFSGKFLKAGGSIGASEGNRDYFGTVIGCDSETVRQTELGEHFFSIVYSKHMYTNAGDMVFANGEADAARTENKLVGNIGNQNDTLRDYYCLLYVAVDDCEFGTDYDAVDGLVSRVTVRYGGDELIWGMDISAEKKNCGFDSVKGEIYLFGKNQTLELNTGGSANVKYGRVEFVWNRPKPFEGETATGDTATGALTALDVPNYTDGWATDFGRITAGYGIPTDAYPISSSEKFIEWLGLSEGSEGYSYGYLTQDFSISNSLAGTVTTLAGGRTFDGAGRTITFGASNWLRPSSVIKTDNLAAYNGAGARIVNSTVAIRGGIIAVNQGTIKNLSMYMSAETITWTSANINTEGSGVGGLIGAMVGMNNGVIENCSIRIDSGSTNRDDAHTDTKGFIVHKEGRANSDRTILSVGGLVGANVGGRVSYSGAVINGALKACNGGTNNTQPTCFLGGVIGMMSGGTAEYLTVKGSGAIVNLSGATASGKFTTVGGIIGAAAIGAAYTSGTAANDVMLTASSIGKMHCDMDGVIGNTGTANIGRTIGFLSNTSNVGLGGFSAYNTAEFSTSASVSNGWFHGYHNADTGRNVSYVPLVGGMNNSASTTRSGGAVWVQKNGTTVAPSTGFYNAYFDYWSKDTRLAIEFGHPAAISSVSGTRVSGTVANDSRCVVDGDFYTGTAYTASVNASLYTLAGDALAFGNMRSTDTRSTSGTQITSATSLPLSGNGNFYLSGDTTITLASNSNSDGSRVNKTSMANFSGTLDGNGHTLTISISNHYLKTTGANMYGIGLLIDQMSGGTVRNLKLVVSAGKYLFTRFSGHDMCFGPLVGYMTGGTVDNVKVSTSGELCADSNVASYKFGLGGMIGRMTGGTVKNSLSEMNATLNICPGTESFSIDYVYGGVVGHLSGGTLENVALSGSGTYTYSHDKNKNRFMGLYATVIKAENNFSSPTIRGAWLIDCTISIATGRSANCSGFFGGLPTSTSQPYGDRYLSYSNGTTYRTGNTGTDGWFGTANTARNLHYYEGNLDFGKYTGDQGVTGATLPTGGDNVGGVSDYSLYIDRALVFPDAEYKSRVIAVVRNVQRGFAIKGCGEINWSHDGDGLALASFTNPNPTSGTEKPELKVGWKIVQKGKLYLTNGDGEIQTSDQTAFKEFDGSDIATAVKENDPNKYAWTYTVFDWSGSFPLAWSAQGESGGVYDPVIRLSSAIPGTTETVTPSSRENSGYYFNDPTGRYVKTTYNTPANLTYSITKTALIVNPVASPGWDETRSANFLVPRGETGSIVQLVFYEDPACQIEAFREDFDTYEYAANMGINLVIERQSRIGGSVYYVIAYFKDENSSGGFAAICNPTAFQVEVDNADPVISLADTVYIPDGDGRLTAEKTVTITDVSPLAYTIITQPAVAVAVRNPEYGVYVLSFADTAEVSFSVTDSVGREASADFLIDVEVPQMSLEFNTSTYTDAGGVSTEFINSSGHQINVQTLSDNYVDEYYLAEHFFWRVVDRDGTVLYDGRPADFNLSAYVLSLNFDAPVDFDDVILEVWTEDSVGHRTEYRIGGGEGGAERLLIDTRTYALNVSASHIYKEGNPLPYTAAPQLRITDAVTGLNRTANMGGTINLRRFDAITVANANASAGFTYLGFGADVDFCRTAGSSGVINPADESLDTEIYGTNAPFVIDGQPRSGMPMATSINLMLFYRLMLRVGFNGDTTRPTGRGNIDTSSLVGTITRSTGQAAIATAAYIEVAVVGEDGGVIAGSIDGNIEKIYTVSFDILEEYANYYEIDTESATAVLSIVDPDNPSIEFSASAVALKYATDSDGFVGNWTGKDRTALGWSILGRGGIVNAALSRSGTVVSKTTASGTDAGYGYSQFLADYKTENRGAEFFDDFNYTIRRNGKTVSAERILDAGSYSVTVYIKSGKGFVGSFTLNITVGRKTVYAYAFSQETIYGNGLYTGGYFVDWNGERASDGGVLEADRTAQTLTYTLVGQDAVYEIPERGIKVKIGTYADGRINLAVGGTTGYTLNAALSGNTLTVSSFAFADGAYTALPQASSSRTSVGSFNGVISLDGGSFQNYSISATNAPNLTINKRPITIVIADTAKGYNTADPATFNWAPSATEGLGFAPGDNAGSFVAILSRAEGETVGQSYTISGTFTNSNYDVSVINGRLTVVKLQLQYILTGLTGAFCDDVTDYLGTVAAMIKNANAADSLYVTVVYRVGFDSSGSPIFADRDYNVLTMNADGSFSLAPDASVIKREGNIYKFFGKEEEDGAIGWHNAAWTKEGNYVFRLLIGSNAANAETVLGNYAYDNTEDRVFTVSPRPITLVVLDQTVRYGDSVNSTGGLNSTFKIQGVPNGVTISPEELNRLAVNKDRAAVYVGQYPSALYINNGASIITLHDTDGRSYAVSVVRGNLTIEKRELTVTWNSSVTDTLIYDGTDHKSKIAASINASAAVSNIVSGDNRYLSVSLSYYDVNNAAVSSFVNAGGYYVKATLNGDRAGNYYLNPVSKIKRVNIDKATTEIAFFGSEWNEGRNALPYKVFSSGSKRGQTNSAIFNVSCTDRDANIYVSSAEVLNGSSTHYNFDNRWVFTIITSYAGGWTENKYIGWNGLPETLAYGTYEMWVDAPETSNFYGASGRCMFVVAQQTAAAPAAASDGLADGSYNNYNQCGDARFYAQNATKTVVIKEGTTTLNFSNGYGGFVGANMNYNNLPSTGYGVGRGVTLSNGGGALNKVPGGSYVSITWGYIYANIELSPELYMAQQNGLLTLTITATARSDKYVNNAWNYNDADLTALLVRPIKNSSYYGFGRSDANESCYMLEWGNNRSTIISNLLFGGLAVNRIIHEADQSRGYNTTVTDTISGLPSSAYRVMLYAHLAPKDWDTGKNYAGMNVQFSNVSITATVNDSAAPTIDTSTLSVGSSGTGLVVSSSKTVDGVTEHYNDGAKYYQITVKDSGVGINPYTFRAVFGRQGKSDVTYTAAPKTGTSANLVGGVKALTVYGNTSGNTVDYRTVVFQTPFLASDVTSLKSIEVEDFKGNKLRQTFTDRTIDVAAPDISSITIDGGPYNEGKWYSAGKNVRFTVTDANFNSNNVKLYYYENGTRREISIRHTGNGVFDTNQTLSKNTLYYIEAWDANFNKAVKSFYFHIDTQSETSSPPLIFEVEVSNGFVIESEFGSAENSGRWNTGSIEITAAIENPQGGMGDGLGKFEYLALDYGNADELSAYTSGNYRGDIFADRWRALSLEVHEDGSRYFSTLTLSAQQQKLYVMRFATEAGNYIYKPVGLVRIDSVVPQIFGTVADMNGKLAESGKWVGKGIIFNISGINGLSKGTLQYKVETDKGAVKVNWTSAGFDGDSYAVTDSYFAGTLIVGNQTVNGDKYSFRFLPGSGDENQAVYLKFGDENFFDVRLDCTPPQIETGTSDWQADQSTAVILTSDIGSGVADVIVFELDGSGNRENYFTTTGAFSYAVDAEGNLIGTPIADTRRVVYESGEYRFDFGARTYKIRAIDAVGNMTEVDYKPQIDDVVPEFDISVISYDNIDNVGFNFVDAGMLGGTTPLQVFADAENFNNYGFEIANGKKVLFVSFNGQRYVGFFGGTGTNYAVYDGSIAITYGGSNAPVAGLGFANVELKPGEARVRATSSDGSAIYNVIDPLHSYENGLWTTDTVRFILTRLKVGKSGGTLYYSNNGMSDITSDWIPVYTAGVNVARPDSGETSVNLSEFVEAAGDRASTYTFRFVSLSGVRVYYNFRSGASEEREAASVTAGDYNFAVNIDTAAPEIYGVEYRIDGTSFWSAISGLAVADWFTANVNIRFKANDLFTTSASSGIASVVLTKIKNGQSEETEIEAGDDGYYIFVMTETAGYTVTVTDGVGSVYSYNIEERKIDTVPLKLEETVTSDGSPYVSGSWATSDVTFEITTENGLSGGKLTYGISGKSGQTEGLELISERLEGNKVVKVYRLTVSEDVEYTEYSFTLENQAGNAAYSQRTTYVRLDKTLPEIIMDVISGTLPTGDTWSTTPVTLGIRVSDETSGVEAGSFSVTADGVPLTLQRNDRGQYVLPVSDMREYVFCVRDNAGNVNEKTVSFNIDATPPVWSETNPVEAYVDYGTANQTVYDTEAGNWSVKPVTLVFNVRFNATAERAGVIEYSADSGVNWQTLFACGDENYRVAGKEDRFVYTFKDGETLADVNGIFSFRAKSLSGIVNEGENPTGYSIKVDQTALSISAEYLYANGAAWTTPWANRDLKAAFEATYGKSGATLQVSADGGANWTDVRRYENGAKVEDFVIAPDANIGNYVFRLVKGASASVTAQTAVELVRFDTAEPELSLAAVNTESGTKYSKGSWSGEGVTFRFTLVMGASYKDTDFLFSNDNGNTFAYMWRTENGATVTSHENLSDFSVSAAVGSGLGARYTVTFSYSVTEEIIQTRFMFAVNYETQDTETRGNGYYRLDRSFNDVNSVRIDRVKSLFLEAGDGSKVTVLKSDNSDYDYSAIGNWYNGNVTFTFAVRSYASGGSLRYSVDGAPLTSESVIRGAVTRGVDSEGRTYADTVYTLTLNSTVNAAFKFVAQSTAGLETWFDAEDGSADDAVSFFVSIDKNMPMLINNNLSYYRDLNGNGSYDVPYAPSANSYVSDDGVLAVFAISDGDSGVDVSGITVAKDGEDVAISPYDGNGRYSFVITDSKTYTLTVRDNAGNTIVRSFRIGVDSVKPTLSVSVVNDGFSPDDWITDALEFRFAGTVFGSSGGFIEYSSDGVNFRTAGSAADVFAFPEIYFAGNVVFRAKSHAGIASDEQTFTVKVDRQDYSINVVQYVGSFVGNYADVMLSKPAPYKRGDTVDISVIARRPYSFAAYEEDGGARTGMNGGETFTVGFTGDGDIADKEIVLRFGEELTLRYSNLKQSVQFSGTNYGVLTGPVVALTAAGNNLTSYLTVTYSKGGVNYRLSELGVFYSGTELIRRLGEFDITVEIANPDYTIANATGYKLNVCYFGETGSENDPFVLNYEEDFAFLNEDMYAGNYYFVLGKDVTINDANARVTAAFTGHLDGKNRIITLGAQLAENGMAGGLFRELNGATVSNIGFRMFETKIDLQSGNTTFGTLADKATDSTVYNVYVIADYTAVGNYEGDFLFGGLVGKAEGTTSFDNVYTDASFNLTGLKADTVSVGGVYGTADDSVTVENSYSVAVIRANEGEGVSAGMFGGDGRDVGPSNEAVRSNVYIGGRWVADTEEGAAIVSYANLYNGTNYVLNSRYSGIAAPVRVGDIVKIRFNSDFYGAYSVIGDRVIFEISEFNGFNAIDKYLWAEFTQTADFGLGTDGQPVTGLIAKDAEFRGVYDGNGFSIELTAKANGSYALFDTVRGTVKNVTLSDVSVDVTLDERGYASVLVGTLRGGTVANTVVGGTLKVNAENSSEEAAVAIIAANAEEGAEIYDVLVSALMTVDANLLELGAVAANLEDGKIDNVIVISTVNATVDKRASLGAIAGMVSGTSEISDAYALSGNTYLDGSSYDVLVGYDRTQEGVQASYTDFDTVMTRNNYYLDGRDVSDVLREQFENEFEGGGVGTVTDPFVIENARDFNKISRYMFANYEIRPMIVGADGRKIAANYLDFGDSFETVGRGMMFTGSLRGTAIDDGNGGWVWVTLVGVTDSLFDINCGTVSILNITANVSKRLTGNGTFGLVANENYGTVRQVDITGSISVSTSAAIDLTVGAVVGKNVGGNLSEIIVSANVTLRGIRVTAGLIAGEVSGNGDEAIVTDCLAEAVLKVTGNFVTAGVYVGYLDNPSLMDVANITSDDPRLNLNVKG